MFDTIHHIAIIGSDYEKSKHFYVDLLGFKVIRENYRKERDDYKIDLACGPQEIELFIIKNAPARVNYPEALGLRHAQYREKALSEIQNRLLDDNSSIHTDSPALSADSGKPALSLSSADQTWFELSSDCSDEEKEQMIKAATFIKSCLRHSDK